MAPVRVVDVESVGHEMDSTKRTERTSAASDPASDTRLFYSRLQFITVSLCTSRPHDPQRLVTPDNLCLTKRKESLAKDWRVNGWQVIGFSARDF